MKSKILDDCRLVRDLRLAAHDADCQEMYDLFVHAALLEQKVYNKLKRARASDHTVAYCLELMAPRFSTLN